MFKLCAAFLFFSRLLSAETLSVNGQWFKVTTPHFTVVTNSTEKQARKTAMELERMRVVFRILLPNVADDASSPIIALAFKDKKGFEAIEPKAYLAKGQLTRTGYFIQTPTRNYIMLRLDSSQEEYPNATVYHEYSHFVAHKAVDLPLWLNEGLAEFYQNSKVREKNTLVGEPSMNSIFYLRHNPLIPLQTLLTIDHFSPYYHEESKASVFYTESWALVHYLQITDAKNRTNRLADYAKLVVDEHKDSVTAAQQAFGDLKDLQTALGKYVNRRNFSMFQLKDSVLIDKSTIQVHPITIPEVNAYRAEALVGNDRSSEARTLLNNILQTNPQLAIAHEALAMLEFREHNIEEAQKQFEEAIKFDAGSYITHYYYAAISMTSGQKGIDDAIEASLKTCMELNPAFAPAYDQLAQLYAIRRRNLDEAHTLNIKAIQLDPSVLAYRLNTASILAMRDNFVSAIEVLTSALPLTRSAEEKAMVQLRIAQFNSRLLAEQNGSTMTPLSGNSAAPE